MHPVALQLISNPISYAINGRYIPIDLRFHGLDIEIRAVLPRACNFAELPATLAE
jgi:hypothetical protein